PTKESRATPVSGPAPPSGHRGRSLEVQIRSAVASAMVPVAVVMAAGAVERSAQVDAGNDADCRPARGRSRAGAADAVPMRGQGARRSVGETGASSGRISPHAGRRAGEGGRSGRAVAAGAGDGSAVVMAGQRAGVVGRET